MCWMSGYAECHIQALYAEWHYAQCHYAECRYAECLSADEMALLMKQPCTALSGTLNY